MAIVKFEVDPGQSTGYTEGTQYGVKYDGTNLEDLKTLIKKSEDLNENALQYDEDGDLYVDDWPVSIGDWLVVDKYGNTGTPSEEDISKYFRKVSTVDDARLSYLFGE